MKKLLKNSLGWFVFGMFLGGGLAITQYPQQKLFQYDCVQKADAVGEIWTGYVDHTYPDSEALIVQYMKPEAYWDYLQPQEVKGLTRLPSKRCFDVKGVR